MKNQLAIAVVVIVLSAIGGFAVSFYRIGDIATQEQLFAQEQYYRGAYDVCTLFGERVFLEPLLQVIDGCLQSIGIAYETDWYGQDSIGWQWPLSASETP